MHCFEFRTLLQAQRQRCLSQVNAATIGLSGEGLCIGNQFKSLEGAALANAPVEMGNGMAINESQELQDIEAALARIGDGSYGTCIDCGGEIGRSRLKTVPTAKRCPPCEIRISPIS